MKFLTNPPQGYANETTTSNHLLTYAVNQPEFLANVASLWRKEHAPFSSLLAKGKLEILFW